MTIAKPASTTTIFTEITALASQTGAINLGQGFPDQHGPRKMLDACSTSEMRLHGLTWLVTQRAGIR
jgi:aspartate/methionine/tyrosine aminotransferase